MKLFSERSVLLLCVFTFALYVSNTFRNKAVPQNQPHYLQEVPSIHPNHLAVSTLNGYVAASNNIVPPFETSSLLHHSALLNTHHNYFSEGSIGQPWPFGARFAAHAVSNQNLFADSKGWGSTKYFSTVQIVTVGDEYFFVGRGVCGLYIYKYSEGELTAVNSCGIKFADSNGWGDADHYSTIKATAVGGSLYISGRGYCGMHIYKLVGNDVQLISMCEVPFSDSEGWNKPEYYSTIQAGAANGNFYVFGRGKCGIEIYQMWKDNIYLVNKCLIPLSDELGWNRKEYYSTITSVVLYNEVYVIGRSACGIVVYKTLAGKKVMPVNICIIPLADKYGWAKEKYYTTIRAVADDHSVWIVGRGWYGLEVYRLVGSEVTAVNKYGIEWSDPKGWGDLSNYATIGAAVARNVLYIYARANCGMTIYTMREDGSPLHVRDCEPLWADSKGWSSSKYFSTIQGTGGNGLVLSARGPCGMLAYELNESSIVPILKCA